MSSLFAILPPPDSPSPCAYHSSLPVLDHIVSSLHLLLLPDLLPYASHSSQPAHRSAGPSQSFYPPTVSPHIYIYMARKRRLNSLSSLFIPNFMYQSSSSKSSPKSRSRSAAPQPATAQDPFSVALLSFVPADGYVQLQNQNLLDEDPFANLSYPSILSAPPRPSPSSPSTSPHTRSTRSPLSSVNPSISDVSLTHTTIPTSPSSPASLTHRLVSPPLLARPAYTKPAFKPTQSLPSLRVLARGEVLPTKKIRKGRVGATLPIEPWNTTTSPEIEQTIISSDPSSSWLSNLDTLPSPGYSGNQNFDPDQYLSARLYVGSFDELSSDANDFSEETEDGSSHSLSLLRMPSDPWSPHSWDTSSMSNMSHTSSLTAYSIESDSQTHISPTSSIYSRPDPFQIDYRPTSNPIEFDAESLRVARFSFSDSPTSSWSRSPSPPSDLEDNFLSPSNNARPFNQEIEFRPSTSAETIKPKPSRSPSSPQRSSVFSEFDSISDQEDSLLSSPEVGRTPCNSAYSSSDETYLEPEIMSLAYDSDPGHFPGHWMEEAIDGGDGPNHRYQDRSYHDGGDSSESAGNQEYLDARDSGGVSGGSGGGGRDDDDGQNWNRKRPDQLSLASNFFDSDDEDEDDHQPQTNGSGITHPITSSSPFGDISNSDSDDVPLARSIPTALKAQRTIRKEVRNESLQRRQERALRIQSESPDSRILSSLPQTAPRSRAETSSSKPMQKHISPDDLTNKLLNLQVEGSTPAVSSARSLRLRRSSGDLIRTGGNNHMCVDSRERLIKPKKSLQFPKSYVSAPSSTRSDMISRVTVSGHTHSGRLERASVDDRRFGRSKTTASSRGYSTGDELGYRRRPSEEPDIGFRAIDAPPLPVPPPYEAVSRIKHDKLWQQRIFIGDLQRFSSVQIGTSTSAQDVIDTLEGLGELQGDGWMLFELAQDFGMERPVRSFEILSDIIGSWSVAKTVNLFVLKRTTLAPVLSVSAMPTSSPTFRGYIDYEVKRGKWAKRWMELREHGLWLSKRDSMKDEMFLCRLSSFDVYSVTRIQKSPKPFVFAVKSTDNLALFEDTADYLHKFSCKEADGLKWMTNILLARSYILHKEGRVAHVTSAPPTMSRKARPAQPFVSVSAPVSAPTLTKATFEPGSLLAKRSQF